MSRAQSSLNDPFSWINQAVVPNSDHVNTVTKRNGKSLNDMVEKKCKKTHSERQVTEQPRDLDLNYLFNKPKPCDRDIDILNYIDPKQVDKEEETEAMDLNYLFSKNELKHHYKYQNDENAIDNLMNEYGQWIESAVKRKVGKIKKKFVEMQPQARISFIQPPSHRPPPPPNARS
eukprot:144229_1